MARVEARAAALAGRTTELALDCPQDPRRFQSFSQLCRPSAGLSPKKGLIKRDHA
jgi:hypothetical protein